MRIVASFEAPIELLSVNKRTATEIKFEVQNTAAGRKAAFILGFKGGDVGTSVQLISCYFRLYAVIPLTLIPHRCRNLQLKLGALHRVSLYSSSFCVLKPDV